MGVNKFLKILLTLLGWGYVLGAQGELYTPELAAKWGDQRRAGKTAYYFLTTCKQWFGKYVVDCSGMIMYILGVMNPEYNKASKDMTADMMYDRAIKKGPIATIPEVPGIAVHRGGHIGIYIGNGKVIEAAGVSKGVIVTGLTSPGTSKPWTHWLYLHPLDYTPETVSVPETPATFFITKLLKRGKINDNAQVRMIQQKLKDHKYSVGAIDGIFGPRTERAVKAFQADLKLLVDGIVGKQTTTALGGTYKG